MIPFPFHYPWISFDIKKAGHLGSCYEFHMKFRSLKLLIMKRNHFHPWISFDIKKAGHLGPAMNFMKSERSLKLLTFDNEKESLSSMDFF